MPITDKSWGSVVEIVGRGMPRGVSSSGLGQEQVQGQEPVPDALHSLDDMDLEPFRDS